MEGGKVYLTSPVRREVQQQVGTYDENTILSDWDFWIRSVLAGWKWKDCKQPMFYRRTQNKSITAKGGFVMGATSKDMEYMANKWQPTLIKYNYKLSTLWRGNKTP